jgi:hypothetical protein
MQPVLKSMKQDKSFSTAVFSVQSVAGTKINDKTPPTYCIKQKLPNVLSSCRFTGCFDDLWGLFSSQIKRQTRLVNVAAIVHKCEGYK